MLEKQLSEARHLARAKGTVLWRYPGRGRRDAGVVRILPAALRVSEMAASAYAPISLGVFHQLTRCSPSGSALVYIEGVFRAHCESGSGRKELVASKP
jgi:hypothetical protein